MSKKNHNQYLFEIGVEELPSGYIAVAISSMVKYFRNKLQKVEIDYKYIKDFSTPRRLAIFISGLPKKQDDRIKEIKGPPKAIAYDDEDNLTRAGEGFLRSRNLNESDITFTKMKKGVYLTASKKIKGKKTREILEKISKKVIESINFPKKMRWGNHAISFARPIRWLLALYNSDVIEFELDNLKTDRETYGNRIQKLQNKLTIKDCDSYESKLKEHYVIPNFAERKKIIKNQIEKVFSEKSEQVVADDELLDTVTNLVEFPTVEVAIFQERFLKLPRLLVKSTLSEHQKYFAVENQENKNLVNKFVFVSNSYPQQTEKIKYGNERVVNARLADAAFFFAEDTKKPLEEFVPKLKGILFQKKLGSMYDKKERIVSLTKYLCSKLNADKEITVNCQRAAQLCKADLASLMLGEKEFAKLQGYIGSVYAKKSGEKEETVRAIRKQYAYEPDELKNLSRTSAILAIADRVDSVCGIIGVGMIPTGSKDPFALRRSANVVVQLLDINNFEISLLDLIEFSFSLLEDKLEDNQNKKEVVKFFVDRINWFIKQNNIDYDVADAVMAIGIANIPDLKSRAKNLQQFKDKKDFRDLIVGFKRASNILEKSEQKVQLDTEKLLESEEKELYEKLINIQPEYRKHLKEKNYKYGLELLVGMKEYIDLFFDNVMVMVEREEIRENRMALLRNINEIFLEIADLSEIVYEGE